MNDPNPPKVAAFKKALADNGIYGLIRPPFLHCAPPMVIQEDELNDALERVDKSLDVLDY